MREHADPRKESLTDPFLTPPEVFVKDYPDLYQLAVGLVNWRWVQGLTTPEL